VGRKSDIEKLEAILAQMKESQESEEKAIAENKPILRRYKYPVGLLLGDDVFVSLIKELVGKNTAVGTENTGTTIETASVVIWALKSDQDKVKAMLEQITKATEKAWEQGEPAQ
jgi:D-aminopeptidase